MTIGALYLLVEIFSAHHLETFTIDKFVRIEESTLTATLLWVEWRGREINHLLHFLAFAKESLTEFHHINPIVVAPLRLVALGATKTVLEVESIDIERYTLCHIANACIIKKPSSDGHVHSRKNGGALIICCKDKHISFILQILEQQIQRKMHFSFDAS